MHNAKMNMWMLMYYRVLQLHPIRLEVSCGFNRRKLGWAQVDPLLGWVRHRFLLGNYRIFFGSMVLIFPSISFHCYMYGIIEQVSIVLHPKQCTRIFYQPQHHSISNVFIDNCLFHKQWTFFSDFCIACYHQLIMISKEEVRKSFQNGEYTVLDKSKSKAKR